MKIQNIALQNVQGHEKTSFELHSGVNVIKGSSHQGKSTLIRAIRWTAFNEPKGVDLKTWGAKDTQCTIELGDASITRFKNKTDNGYVLNGETFKAIRFGVPQEIADVLQLTKINFQPQQELYFLFTKSSGEVAEILNKIAKIDEVDKCYKAINQIIRETTHEVNSLKRRIKEKKEEFDSLKWAEKAQKQVKQIKKDIAKLVETQQTVDRLTNSLHTITELVDYIDQAQEYLKIKTVVDDIRAKVLRLKSINKKKDRLSELILQIEHNEGIVQNEAEMTQCKSDIASIKDLLKKKRILSLECTQLKKACTEIDLHKERIKTLRKEKSLARKERNDLEFKYGEEFCKNCGAHRSAWRK